MPRRRRVLAAGVAGLFGALSSPAQAATPSIRLDQLNLVNLSHVNDPATTNVFPGDPAFTLETIATIPDDGYYLQFVREGEHTGTHWGAPGHFNTGEALADDMDPADLFLPAVKIDIRDRAAANADYAVTIDDIKAWERKHGRIPNGSMVVLWTGWDAKWGTPAYPNLDADGVPHQPGFSIPAGQGRVGADRHRAARTPRWHRHRHVQPGRRHRGDVHRVQAGVPAPPDQPGDPGEPAQTPGHRCVGPRRRPDQPQGRGFDRDRLRHDPAGCRPGLTQVRREAAGALRRNRIRPSGLALWGCLAGNRLCA
ncbi:cyclase family protein [Lentzea aerocolonigenes]|uniref:cyclase family protein n=1 Tax=Lentzea aerocolonigenes TaxID=68170 RepID=UPI001E2ED9D5|nr:cyclase family protein [Lentzea aerocolonigenes]